MRYEGIIFWGLLVLLCLVSLTTVRDWWGLFRRGYDHAVQALKWSPYLGYITGESSKSKHHMVPESELGRFYDSDKQSHIFPRSRRST